MRGLKSIVVANLKVISDGVKKIILFPIHTL